jgi:hypothetical protein
MEAHTLLEMAQIAGVQPSRWVSNVLLDFNVQVLGIPTTESWVIAGGNWRIRVFNARNLSTRVIRSQVIACLFHSNTYRGAIAEVTDPGFSRRQSTGMAAR